MITTTTENQNLATLREVFSGISLADMQAEIDLGEIVLHDGPEAAYLTAVWLTRQFFWDHPIHKNKLPPSKQAMLSTLDQAKYMALTYLLEDWKELGERATACLLNDAQQTGWHTSKFFNYDNLEELLASILDEQDTKVGVSTWGFVLRELMPAAKRYGVDPRDLYSVKSQVKKLRYLVPIARNILEDNNLTEAEKELNLKHFIKQAADNSVTPAAFKLEADNYRGRHAPEIVRLVGYESIMPNNETWIVVRCPRVLDERTVEMMLGAKVDLRVTDWTAFTSEIAQMMKSYTSLSPEQQDALQQTMAILSGKGDHERGNEP